MTYIFFCKAGCEVNKQADQLGASSPCHSCDKDMSLSTLSSWLNTVITRSSLATMVMWPTIVTCIGSNNQLNPIMFYRIFKKPLIFFYDIAFGQYVSHIELTCMNSITQKLMFSVTYDINTLFTVSHDPFTSHAQVYYNGGLAR